MTINKEIVVLDRDGVINHDSDDYIKSADEWLPIPGSIEAIASLAQAKISVAVATNQSGIGRGLYDEYALAQMHDKMLALVEAAGGSIAAVCYCPHLPDDHCQCRKPATGLLEQIQEHLQISLQGALFVGDSLKDIRAAIAFDMIPVLVRTGKGAETEALLEQESLSISVPVFDSLQAVIAHYFPETDRG